MHGVGIIGQTRHYGMAHFVRGDDFLFLFGNNAALFLRAGNHAFHGFVHVVVIHRVFIGAGGQNGGLVNHVGQVRPHKTRGAFGHRMQIHFRREFDLFGMHFQNGFAPFQIRRGHGHMAVKTARADQRGIQHVRAVGGRHQNNALFAFKTVQLNQQLV